MLCVQAGMKVNASGSIVVVMWNYFVALTLFVYFVALTLFVSVCTLNRCSSEQRLWMLFYGLEERVCCWQKTWDLYIFLSWTNSEFAVPTTLANFSLNLLSFTAEFCYNLSYSVCCLLGLRLSPWDLVNIPDRAVQTNHSGKAVCGALCLWWHKRKCNFHVPVPLVFVQVPQASCLRTMEQTFVKLNEPWAPRLVKSKHSHGTRTDPVRAVRRQLVSWRQFRRYRRRALRLTQMQPSVFRSPKVVTKIVYALQLSFDLASDSLKSFLAQKFLCRNYADADMV